MDQQSTLAFATKGAGSNDEARLVSLLGATACEVFPFNPARKLQSLRRLLRQIRRNRPSLVVMEGSGLAGGLACIVGRLHFRTRYLVSSGDAVGPFIGAQYPLLRPFAAMYERLLCRLADGFVGWTPYLAGRALTFGTPRVMTAAGWADFTVDDATLDRERREVRQRWGIPPGAIVFGLVGSLVWNRRYQYCYGAELVRAILHSNRDELFVLVVGGGSGLDELRRILPGGGANRVILTGPVPSTEVRAHLAAMDIGSLPQSVDGVGSFRYTTKISEYAAVRLPVVTGQIPMAYDLDQGWLWRLGGAAPWSPRYIAELTHLMDSVTVEQIAIRRQATHRLASEFDRHTQITRMSAFVADLLAGTDRKPEK